MNVIAFATIFHLNDAKGKWDMSNGFLTESIPFSLPTPHLFSCKFGTIFNILKFNIHEVNMMCELYVSEKSGFY